MKERCGDEVEQVAELAKKVWRKLDQELPRLAVTCRVERRELSESL